MTLSHSFLRRPLYPCKFSIDKGWILILFCHPSTWRVAVKLNTLLQLHCESVLAGLLRVDWDGD